ncbi:hypothetical protein K439DRAFT_1618913 [Ramaria rubella]|nr:hypothetical protein K439DRAFT_1618913 [Ramaria rubella]
MEWDDQHQGPDIQDLENEELEYMAATMRKWVTVKDEMGLVTCELEEGYCDYINQVYISPEDETEEEDVSLPEIIHGLSAIDLQEVTLDSIRAKHKNMKSSEDWYPYQSKTEQLRKNGLGISTDHFVMASGNILYMNNIPALVANIRDYSNPQVSSLLHFDPEETNGGVTEFWQAQRLKEMPPDLLTPMHRKSFKDYYVNEIVELRDRSLVIPQMWVFRNGRMCADGYKVEITEWMIPFM